MSLRKQERQVPQYRRTKQKILMAEKLIERFGQEYAIKFLDACLASTIGYKKSDGTYVIGDISHSVALKKIIGALLLEFSNAPFKPWKEITPLGDEKFDLKEIIIDLMRELFEESEENADLFYHYLRNAENSQRKNQETKNAKHENAEVVSLYPEKT